MLSKNDLLEAILQECDICIHLYGKIPDGGMDYRPTLGQRNMFELLEYICSCGIGFARAMVEGNWDGYQEEEKAIGGFKPDQFVNLMNIQKEKLTKLFESITDDEFATKKATLPSGEVTKLNKAMLDMPFRCMVGYRMQLFLYAKAAGNKELITPNCWYGVDVETKE